MVASLELDPGCVFALNLGTKGTKFNRRSELYAKIAKDAYAAKGLQ